MLHGWNGGAWNPGGYALGFPWGGLAMGIMFIALVALVAVAMVRMGKAGRLGAVSPNVSHAGKSMRIPSAR
jgi:hypothetical protein